MTGDFVAALQMQIWVQIPSDGFNCGKSCKSKTFSSPSSAHNRAQSFRLIMFDAMMLVLTMMTGQWSVCLCVVCWSFVSLLDGVTAASAAWGDLPRGHRELEGAHSRGTGSWRGSPWWEQGWGFTGQRAPSAAGPSGDHLMWWNEACIRPTAALLTK